MDVMVDDGLSVSNKSVISIANVCAGDVRGCLRREEDNEVNIRIQKVCLQVI